MGDLSIRKIILFIQILNWLSTLRTRKRSLSHIIHGLGRRHTPQYLCEHLPQGHFIPADGHGNSVLSIMCFVTVVTGFDVSGIVFSILRDYNSNPLNRKAISTVQSVTGTWIGFYSQYEYLQSILSRSIVHVKINLKKN